MADYNLPLPVKQPESDFYWDKAKEHELWLRKCNGCGKAYFYPRDFCPSCHSKDVTWVQSSGKGTLYSFVINHRPPPSFGSAPYVIAVVELEEGPRMMTNLVGVEPDPDKIRCDSPVEIVYDDVTEDITLPKFRLAEQREV